MNKRWTCGGSNPGPLECDNNDNGGLSANQVRSDYQYCNNSAQRRLNRGQTVAVWPWLLFAALLFGLTLLGLVGAVADLQADPSGMLGLMGLGMALTPKTVDVPIEHARGNVAWNGDEYEPTELTAQRAAAEALRLERDDLRRENAELRERIDAVRLGREKDGSTLMSKPTEISYKAVRDAFWRAVPAGATLVKIMALPNEEYEAAWKGIFERQADALKPSCGRTTEAEIHRREQVKALHVPEVAARPTMVGLAGGGVPSGDHDRARLLEKATRTEYTPKDGGEKGDPR
jgi:hypothetical protein